MKMTKKILALLLSLAMLLSFAGCDLDTYDYSDGSSSTPSTTISDTKDDTSNTTDTPSQGQESKPTTDSSTQTPPTNEKPNNTQGVGSGTGKTAWRTERVVLRYSPEPYASASCPGADRIGLVCGQI